MLRPGTGQPEEPAAAAAFNINHKVEGKLRVGSSSITTLWMPEVVHYFKENYPKVSIEILDGNCDEIREWIIHGQVDCGFLSSIVADDLKFYPLWDDPLCAVFPEGHPLAARPSVTLSQLFQYPLIIETPGCDSDIPTPDAQVPGEAEYFLQLPGRYPSSWRSCAAGWA